LLLCSTYKPIILAAALAAAALMLAVLPTLWPVMIAQVLIGASSSIFVPAICAISLGIAGHRLFDRRLRHPVFSYA
jgi:predicted MFS family arabinose efflux permease